MKHKSSLTMKRNKDEKPEKPACRHHWMIDQAVDSTSMGKCKYCGEKRMFSAEFELDQSKKIVSVFR